MRETSVRDGIEPIQDVPDRSIDAEKVAAEPATLLKPPAGAGLTMIAGDTVGVCEGDACFVPSLVREHDAD